MDTWMNKWMNVSMDRCMGRRMNRWICGRRKRLRKSIKSFGEQFWHLHPSLLLLSTAPVPGAHPISPQHCRFTWVLVKWFRRVCHEGDRSSSITDRLQLLWEEIIAARDEGCTTGFPDMPHFYLPYRPHLQSLDKRSSWPPSLIVTAGAQCQAHSVCSIKVW